MIYEEGVQALMILHSGRDGVLNDAQKNTATFHLTTPDVISFRIVPNNAGNERRR